MSDLGNKKVMAKNLKRLMVQYNKSRNDVCKDLNIKYTTFTDWINANTYPRIDKIEMMARYFGVSKADLVEDHTNRNDKFDERTLQIVRDMQINGKVILDVYDSPDKKRLIDYAETLQTARLFKNYSVAELNAAHERTDINITESMKKHDEDIMNDDDF